MIPAFILLLYFTDFLSAQTERILPSSRLASRPMNRIPLGVPLASVPLYSRVNAFSGYSKAA
jgi:hypothetical protein